MKKLLMNKQEFEETELKKSNQIYNLDPYLDVNDISRVVRRINKSNLSNECKHPIILLKDNFISKTHNCMVLSSKNWSRCKRYGTQ